jgi:hypothetical protein
MDKRIIQLDAAAFIPHHSDLSGAKVIILLPATYSNLMKRVSCRNEPDSER